MYYILWATPVTTIVYHNKVGIFPSEEDSEQTNLPGVFLLKKPQNFFSPYLTYADEEGTQPIGMWGRKHLRYIKEHRPVLHTTLLLGGKLNSYLAEIDNRAAEMFERLMKQLTEQEGITEQLKAQDQMAWVGAMNSIRNQAEEIINAEIIYT